MDKESVKSHNSISGITWLMHAKPQKTKHNKKIHYGGISGNSNAQDLFL